MTNQSPNDVLAQVNETVMGRVYTHFSAHGSSTGMRLLLIVALAVVVHGLVRLSGISANGSFTGTRSREVRSAL